MDTDKIDQGLLTVINFSSLYVTSIEAEFLSDLTKYLPNTTEITADVRRLLYHHVIYGVCEAVKKDSFGPRCIIYFCATDLLCTRTCDALSAGVTDTFNKILKDIRNKLPIRVYQTKTPFEYYIFLKSNNKNRGISIMEDLVLYACKDQPQYTFNKIKKYASKKGLTFLNQNYFNNITSRMLIAR